MLNLNQGQEMGKCRKCGCAVTLSMGVDRFEWKCTGCFDDRNEIQKLLTIPDWVLLNEEAQRLVKEAKEKKMETKKDDVSGLKSLGSGSTTYATMTGVDAKLLEKFPNRFSHRNYTVKFETNEVTSLCAKTGQPDFCTVTIEYEPDEFCIESKGLKLYLGSYRNQQTFAETMTNNILDHLVELVKPRNMKVVGNFTPRGGIGLMCTAVYVKAANEVFSKSKQVEELK